MKCKRGWGPAKRGKGNFKETLSLHLINTKRLPEIGGNLGGLTEEEGLICSANYMLDHPKSSVHFGKESGPKWGDQTKEALLLFPAPQYSL